MSLSENKLMISALLLFFPFPALAAIVAVAGGGGGTFTSADDCGGGAALARFPGFGCRGFLGLEELAEAMVGGGWR